MAPRTFGMDDFESAQPLGPSGNPMGESGQSRGMSTEEFESAVPKRSGMQVAKEAAQNFIPSVGGVLYDTAHGLYQMGRHPIDTYENFRDLGHGILQKTGVMSGDEHVKNVDALTQHFADKYGGMENFKNTLATDPASVLADASLALTGGGALLRAPAAISRATASISPAVQASINAARATGATVNAAPQAGRVASALEKTGELASKVGNAIDPLQAVIAPVKMAGKAAPYLIGALTHTGEKALQEAEKAGFQGGSAGRAFIENIKGTANTEDAVNEALAATQAMYKQAQADYKAGMIPIKNDRTVLSFNGVNRAIADADKVAAFHGVPLIDSTDAIRRKIKGIVDTWRRYPPGTFHTPEGMDALKKRIGDLYETNPNLTRSEAAVVGKIYGSLAETIKQQAPAYANVMKGFETAEHEIKAIQKELSLPGKKKQNYGTGLNKLQSVMRNNVNTNYGRRAQLAQQLVNAGAKDMMPKLAGQNLQAWIPRGLGRAVTQMAIHGGVGAAAAGFPAALAAIAASAPLASPRLMGNTFYRSGQLRRLGSHIPARPIARGAYQYDQLDKANPYSP